MLVLRSTLGLKQWSYISGACSDRFHARLGRLDILGGVVRRLQGAPPLPLCTANGHLLYS